MSQWKPEFENFCEIHIRALCPECETTEEKMAIGALDAFDDIEEISGRVVSDLHDRGWRAVDGRPMCQACQARHDGLEADYYRDLYEERRLDE